MINEDAGLRRLETQDAAFAGVHLGQPAAGRRLRESAQLVRARDDRVLWAESYARELADVFAVQEDIARAIVAISRDEGVSVLLVEQNSRMALSISNRAYALSTGQVVLSGESRALLADPRVKAAYLGAEV